MFANNAGTGETVVEQLQCDTRRRRDMTCTRALVTLDMLNFWLVILVLRQHTGPSEKPLRLRIGVKIWGDIG